MHADDVTRDFTSHERDVERLSLKKRRSLKKEQQPDMVVTEKVGDGLKIMDRPTKDVVPHMYTAVTTDLECQPPVTR